MWHPLLRQAAAGTGPGVPGYRGTDCRSPGPRDPGTRDLTKATFILEPVWATSAAHFAVSMPTKSRKIVVVKSLKDLSPRKSLLVSRAPQDHESAHTSRKSTIGNHSPNVRVIENSMHDLEWIFDYNAYIIQMVTNILFLFSISLLKLPRILVPSLDHLFIWFLSLVFFNYFW